MRPRGRWRLALASLVLGVLVSGCEPTSEPGTRVPDSSLSQWLGGGEVSGFSRALEPRELVFPADQGSHPDFRNEWWYLTGNLETAGGRRFGYHVTFFRIALSPSEPLTESRPSGWATRQVWMAHVALSDATQGRHQEIERFARGAAGLAGARAEPFRVWLEDWQLRGRPDGNGQTWELRIGADEFALNLVLSALKPIVPHGDGGLSQRGAEPGNATYYYSIPRLKTTGSIGVGDEEFAVAGLSWLDREWGTGALGDDQVGWDWFALQLDDGRDLMYYHLRRAGGEPDPHSVGALIGPDGGVRQLHAAEVTIVPQRWWRDPDGVRYPVAWMLAPGDGARYRIEAVFDDQRMDTTVGYWEGMVDVFDVESGERRGRGYLELAGYE